MRSYLKSYEFIDPSPYELYDYDYSIDFIKWVVTSYGAGSKEQDNMKENCPFEDKCGDITAYFESHLANPTGPSGISLIAPSAGANFHDKSPNFEWSVSDGSPPLEYTIQIASSTDFSSDLIKQKTFEGPEKFLQDNHVKEISLPSYGMYYWRLEVTNPQYNVVGIQTGPTSFTISPPPLQAPQGIEGPSTLVGAEEGTWTINPTGGASGDYYYTWRWKIVNDEVCYPGPGPLGNTEESLIPKDTTATPNDIDCDRWTSGRYEHDKTFTHSQNSTTWDVRIWVQVEDGAEIINRYKTVSIEEPS